LDLYSRLELNFCGTKVNCNTGFLAYRQLDEMLELAGMDRDSLMDAHSDANK